MAIESLGEASADRPRARLGRLIERNDERDFPLYDGRPIEIEAWKWLAIVVAAAAGFAALVLNPISGQWGLLVGRVLFAAIPLGTFIALSKGSGGRSSDRFRGGTSSNMVGFWLLNLAVSALVAFIFGAFSRSCRSSPSCTSSTPGDGCHGRLRWWWPG